MSGHRTRRAKEQEAAYRFRMDMKQRHREYIQNLTEADDVEALKNIDVARVQKKWSVILPHIKAKYPKVDEDEFVIYAELISYLYTYLYTYSDHTSGDGSMGALPKLTKRERILSVKQELEDHEFIQVMLAIYCKYGIREHRIVYREFMKFLKTLPDDFANADNRYEDEIREFENTFLIRLRKDKLKKINGYV